jgi:hypothetical protein
MFDRKYIDLIEIFQYVHINTENMKTGNKRRENVIKQNVKGKTRAMIRNALFDTIKGHTIEHLMENELFRKFVMYYEYWYINFKR